MNIVIPMAGRGHRFKYAGYDTPKPLIDINGKTMIEYAVESIKIEGNYTYIIFDYEDQDINQKLENILKKITPNCNIIKIDYFTDGPASSASLSRNFVDHNDELIIVNCDQIIKDLDESKFLSYARKYDALLGCFISSSNKNSYVKVNENNLVTEVKEKEVISNLATNGLHYWKKASLFFESYDIMVEKDDRTNNEFYVAPSFNFLIENQYKIGIYLFNEHFPVGTPEDLQKYLLNENT